MHPMTLKDRLERIEQAFPSIRLDGLNATKMANGTWMVPIRFDDTLQDPLVMLASMKRRGLHLQSHPSNDRLGSYIYTLTVPTSPRWCTPWVVLAVLGMVGLAVSSLLLASNEKSP